jgi:peptidyl-prolyl cis-trans isomerase SurA
MKTLLRTVLLTIGSLLCAAGIATSASAQSIKATVNDQAITAYDLNQRLKLMALFHQKASAKQALDDLIDDALAEQQAKRRHMDVTDAMVEDRFNAIAKQVKLSPEQFSKALRQNGVDPDTLRKLFRGQIYWALILRAKARSNTDAVSESDIQAEMQKQGITAESATMKEFRLQQIVFVVPKGSPPGLVPQRQRDAEAFRKRFSGCDTSLDLAKSMKGVVVLDIGRRDTSQVDDTLADQLGNTPAGGTLKPEVTERGVEVVAVCSVKEIQSTAGLRAEVTKKLAETQNKDLMETTKAEFRKDAKIVYN